MAFIRFFYYYLLPGIVATVAMMIFIFLFRISSITPRDWNLIKNGFGETIMEYIPLKYAYVTFITIESVVQPILVSLFVYEVYRPFSLLYYFLFSSLIMILFLKVYIPTDSRIRIAFIIILLHFIYFNVFYFIQFYFHHLGKGSLTLF